MPRQPIYWAGAALGFTSHQRRPRRLPLRAIVVTSCLAATVERAAFHHVDCQRECVGRVFAGQELQYEGGE
jgi:hypothetical protein